MIRYFLSPGKWPKIKRYSLDKIVNSKALECPKNKLSLALTIKLLSTYNVLIKYNHIKLLFIANHGRELTRLLKLRKLKHKDDQLLNYFIYSFMLC